MDACVRVCVLLAVLSWAEAFYLPGLAATNFCKKEVQDKAAKGTCRVRAQGAYFATSRVLYHVRAVPVSL